jgi:phosphohistidine phosphatase SixA
MKLARESTVPCSLGSDTAPLLGGFAGARLRRAATALDPLTKASRMQRIPCNSQGDAGNERGFVLLLRHASAGTRLSSPSVDGFRRLDDAGRVVARQLVWSLADHKITRIVSSPLPRCVESVVPIAETRGLVVESRWELGPDVALDDLMTLLLDLPETSLVCTHREVFEKLMGWDVTCEKGGTWVLERNDDELVPALYLEPPTRVLAGERHVLRSA